MEGAGLVTLGKQPILRQISMQVNELMQNYHIQIINNMDGISV